MVEASDKKQSRTLYAYIVIIAALALGLGVLGLGSVIPLPRGVHSSVPLFLLFIGLNLLTCYVLKLQKELREYWALMKITGLPAAIAAGACIAILPTVLHFTFGRALVSEVSFSKGFSIASLGISFLIAAWEELWFRGIFLNYCIQRMPMVALCCIIGLLFMLLHAMNPEISMLAKGPALFMAGAFLTAAYFCFKSIWIPVGLHLGNNYFGSMLHTPYENDMFWGGDGYLTAIILFICFVLLARTYKKDEPYANINPPPQK